MLFSISVLNDLLFQVNHNYDYSCQDTSALIVFIRRNMLQIIQHEINLMKLRIAIPQSCIEDELNQGQMVCLNNN